MQKFMCCLQMLFSLYYVLNWKLTRSKFMLFCIYTLYMQIDNVHANFVADRSAGSLVLERGGEARRQPTGADAP